MKPGPTASEDGFRDLRVRTYQLNQHSLKHHYGGVNESMVDLVSPTRET